MQHGEYGTWMARQQTDPALVARSPPPLLGISVYDRQRRQGVCDNLRTSSKDSKQMGMFNRHASRVTCRGPQMKNFFVEVGCVPLLF